MNSPATPMNEAMRKMPLRNMLIVVAMPSAPAIAMKARMTKAHHSAIAAPLNAGPHPSRGHPDSAASGRITSARITRNYHCRSHHDGPTPRRISAPTTSTFASPTGVSIFQESSSMRPAVSNLNLEPPHTIKVISP